MELTIWLKFIFKTEMMRADSLSKEKEDIFCRKELSLPFFLSGQCTTKNGGQSSLAERHRLQVSDCPYLHSYFIRPSVDQAGGLGLFSLEVRICFCNTAATGTCEGFWFGFSSKVCCKVLY